MSSSIQILEIKIPRESTFTSEEVFDMITQTIQFIQQGHQVVISVTDKKSQRS